MTQLDAMTLDEIRQVRARLRARLYNAIGEVLEAERKASGIVPVAIDVELADAASFGDPDRRFLSGVQVDLGVRL